MKCYKCGEELDMLKWHVCKPKSKPKSYPKGVSNMEAMK
jgi:hypothetical protein